MQEGWASRDDLQSADRNAKRGEEGQSVCLCIEHPCSASLLAPLAAGARDPSRAAPQPGRSNALITLARAEKDLTDFEECHVTASPASRSAPPR